jgi:hypothetical protein
LAFTITTNIGGTAATLVGTDASDSVAAAQLVNISSLQLTAFDADDVAVLGATALSSAIISMGQGDDQVTTGANVSGSSSLIDLGEGSDTFTSANNLSSVSIKGFGGLDTFTITGGTLTSIFLNGNVGADRINIGNNTATAVASSTIVGGSEDDIITIDTTARLTGGRINGQSGDDTITVSRIGATSTTTIFGGQGNDIMSATLRANTTHVIFSGDLGNDTLTGNNQGLNQAGDLLFGGGGNDVMTSSGGADSMSGGDGVDTYVLPTGNYMSVAFTNVVGTGAIDAGDTFTLGTFRGAGISPFIANITDFVGGGTGDLLNTDNNSNALSAIGVAGSGTFGTAGFTYKLSGSYNASNGVFTVTADNLGTDTLIQLNGGATNEFILLQSTSGSTLTAANFV